MRSGAVAAVLGAMGLWSAVAHAGLVPAREHHEAWQVEAEARGLFDMLRATSLPPALHNPVGVAIAREARLHGLDPLLIAAVIHTESRFDHRAQSSFGARGLMQLTPETAGWLLEKRGHALTHPTRLFDPELNVRLGVEYLAQLLRRFGTLEKALIAYNAGPTTARRFEARSALPPRADVVAFDYRAYPKKVLATYATWKARTRPSAMARRERPSLDQYRTPRPSHPGRSSAPERTASEAVDIGSP